MRDNLDPENFASSKVCFLSNFPPRECGIATFTEDLVNAIDKRFNPKLKSRVIALNENNSFYNYDPRVIMQLNKDDIEDFITIAKKLNKNRKIKLICIQHEFGIFGGLYGNYLIPFLETIEKPVAITFHSVLPSPDEMRKRIIKFVASKCAAIIVTANAAINILNKDYGIEKNKIYVVHHGIPDVSFKQAEPVKKKLKLDRKIVLSTFGLLSKGKGIEYMIKALPQLIKKYPNILYLIMGETHPVVRKREGEKYRNELIALVNKLGLKENVKFYNKYLELREIIEYIQASDIYICTNLDEDQISSGTLSYALGCGKAIVSTPSIYAREILSDKRGVLAGFKKPLSFASAVDQILSDSKFKSELEKNAYAYGRAMIWQNVATRYLEIFNKIVKLREDVTEKYPKIKLSHLKTLTDNFGCLQFSELSTPDKNSGYTVDDNSRALIVAVLHNSLFKSEDSAHLIKIYLRFLERAQQQNGNFKNNFRNENEVFNPCSEDAFGRAIWALGYVVDKSSNPETAEKAKNLFENSFNRISRLESPRAKAFSIAGLYNYYKKYNEEKILFAVKPLADSLVDLYNEESSKDWQWFEKYLTYSNSQLSEALFLAYDLLKDEKYLDIAEKSLSFLSKQVFIKNQLSPIGQNGWYNKDGKRAFFDQQPVDASSVVQTYLIAYSITGNKAYYGKAVLAFNWFLGKNHLDQTMYNEATGGCYDGLAKFSLNLNQGAESTISYLMARLLLEEFKRGKAKPIEQVAKELGITLK